MKAINFKISKRLNDLGLLDNIETEYCYYKGMIFDYNEFSSYTDNFTSHNEKEIKALTLEEVIEILPERIEKEINGADDNMIIRYKIEGKYFCAIQYARYMNEEDGEDGDIETFYGEGLFSSYSEITAIEKMLEYLLDNNLIDKK